MRSHAEIIAAAHAGETGHLIFAFTSADKGERMAQIGEMVRRLPLEGLAVSVRLSTTDAQAADPGRSRG